MKQVLIILLIALLGAVFVAAHQTEADRYDLLRKFYGVPQEHLLQTFDQESDFKFGKLLKKIGKIGLNLGKAYLRTQGLPLEDQIEADLKIGKLFKKIGKIGLGLGKLYLKTQGIPLNDEQSDKFWKNLFKVVKHVGKGAIKSYVNQNFDSSSDKVLPMIIGCRETCSNLYGHSSTQAIICKSKCGRY